ncbi:hypothetical protein ACW9UR_21490 [Halovulum sp. GXIMD14794]
MFGGGLANISRESLGAFRDDENGASTIEWMISVGVVVMMAIPVMMIVSGSSERASNDIVVQIEDTDSFGGGGYDGAEGSRSATVSADAENYVPGANMGVGFPLAGEEGSSEEAEELLVAGQTGNQAGLPRFYANAGGVGRGGSGAGVAGTGGGVAPTLGSAAGVTVSGSGDTRPIGPATPERARHEFAFLQENCVDPTVVASVEARQDYLRDHTDVVASGR